MSPLADPRRRSPAAERNRVPILAELLRLLPTHGRMLEIASGTGQHAAHFAAHLEDWHWQPTEFDLPSHASIRAWSAGIDRIAPPLALDVLQSPWPVAAQAWDAIFCANMLHISPWACCAGLMRGADESLKATGLLILYGPFLVEGVATAPGNVAFDGDLRERDPAWGLRQLGAVEATAGEFGLRLRERVAMPANNLLLVFERAVPAPLWRRNDDERAWP